MKEEYSKLRRGLFWLFSFLFLGMAPVVVFYSLGYKFDDKSRKFLKTGAISIKTAPREAYVIVNGGKMRDLSPCTLRELIPGEYTLDIEKEGYYPYQVTVEIHPSLVCSLDIYLVPRIKNAEKIKFDFKIYKFFVIKHRLTSPRIVAFTDKGVYLIDEDFENARCVSTQSLGEDISGSLEGIRLIGESFIFWNKNNIWRLPASPNGGRSGGGWTLFYRASESIKYVFFGIKEKYLIVCDGLAVMALDINEPQVTFHIFDLKSINAGLFYDVSRETLYIRDKVPPANSFSLFKIKLTPIVREDDRKKPDF